MTASLKNILIIGSGGREHALCWKLKQSPQAGEIYCAPGNGGIGEVAHCLQLSTQKEILAFCAEKKIALVAIGPEQPLVEGLGDALRAAGIAVFGPDAGAARLEGSKGFTKEICRKYTIPTAAYGTFTDPTAALAYLEGKSFPIVVKADGLAAGKGVIIAQNKTEAQAAVEAIFSGLFGDAGNTVVIEEFLEGEEVSFFALADGKTAVEFGFAQDHKRVGEKDTGPNTGGMGTYSPPPAMKDALRRRVMDEIIHPTLRAMEKEGAPFSGVLFAGLMLTADGPKLLEYNTRFGDPETQSLMRRLDGDLLPLLEACAHGTLSGLPPVRMKKDAAICVVMAAKGYPDQYEKGSVIGGLEKAGALPDVVVFHAGTQRKDEKIIAAGGRVLGVTATGATFGEAREKAYAAVDAIDWPQGFCRRDIGWRALMQE